MPQNYDDIIEVQVTNAPNANKLLNGGYVLLGVHPITSVRQDNQGNSFVQQGVTFVVGRGADTTHIELGRGVQPESK